jgi:NADH-quinone oxidoreductase subunit J
VETLVFAIFAILAVASAIVVVSHRNPVYSVMSLVVTLVSLAALFVLLGAPLLAAMLILVYTGAILVLFLFVLMLLNVGRETPSGGGGMGQKVGAVVATLLFGAVLLFLLWGSRVGFELAPLTEEYVELQPLARALLSKYLLPFEMAGLLLLAAVTAATVLARKPAKGERKGS